mgnify:CR=1 FL=1
MEPAAIAAAPVALNCAADVRQVETAVTRPHNPVGTQLCTNATDAVIATAAKAPMQKKRSEEHTS